MRELSVGWSQKVFFQDLVDVMEIGNRLKVKMVMATDKKAGP